MGRGPGADNGGTRIEKENSSRTRDLNEKLGPRYHCGQQESWVDQPMEGEGVQAVKGR